MKVSHTVFAAAALTALAACSAQPAPAQVSQLCTATYPDGTVEVVPDDYCVDRTSWRYGGVYYPPVWHFGGSTSSRNGHWYVRGGDTRRPVNVVLVVREPRYGGNTRAQGAARSYNEGVRKTLGTTPTYRPQNVLGTGGRTTARSADDFRAKTSTSNTTRSVSPRRR